jgi:hypothetical protein
MDETGAASINDTRMFIYPWNRAEDDAEKNSGRNLNRWYP